MIGLKLFDFFVKFPSESVFRVCLEKWMADPTKFEYYVHFLTKQNKPAWASQMLFNAMNRSPVFFNFIAKLENRESVEFVLNDIKEEDCTTLLANLTKFESHKEHVVHLVIQKMSIKKLEGLFEAASQNAENKSFLEHFRNANNYIIRRLLGRRYNSLKARFLLSKLEISALLDFRDESANHNIFRALQANKLDHLILIFLKMVDQSQKKLKPVIKALIEEKDEEGVSVSEYLLSSPNNLFFNYLNSYFDEKIFTDFKFLEAEVTQSKLTKLPQTSDPFSSEATLKKAIFKTVETNREQLRTLFQLFRDSPSLDAMEKQKMLKFEGTFIDDEDKFDAMMSEVLQESLVAVDMEYYKAPNHSLTDCECFSLMPRQKL